MSKGEWINLNVSDGTQMRAFVARPGAPGARPGIIVMQEVFGVNPHIQDVAERLAKEGFVAIAPEVFHRTAPPGWQGDYINVATAMPHASQATREGLGADLSACYDWLNKNDGVKRESIACLGFCMGGRTAFLANGVLPLKAAVSFYGGQMLQYEDLASKQHAPILFFWGGKDKHIPAEQRAQVLQGLDKKSHPYINVVFSEADHGFFCDKRASFEPKSAREAWALTLAFLKRMD